MNDIENKKPDEMLLDVYFNRRHDYLNKIESLLNDSRYTDVCFLSLCCFIDSLSKDSGLSKNRKKGENGFIKLLCDHSSEFKKIDLLFFNQWTKNDYLQEYAQRFWKQLNNKKDLYNDIKNTIDVDIKLYNIYGDSKDRFIDKNQILNILNKQGFKKIKEAKSYLEHFSNAHTLYHFGRCFIVHDKNSRHFLKENYNLSTGICTYSPNHIITPQLIIETLRNFLDKYKLQCIRENIDPLSGKHRK